MSDDWKDEILPRLQKSLIYKTLSIKCEKNPAGSDTLSLIQKMLLYAHHRSKTVIKNMPEFTLHDSEHLFRVLKLAERLLAKTNIEKLSSPELFLIIACSFFHDIGMAPSEADIQNWKAYWDASDHNGSQENDDEKSDFVKFCRARPDRTSEIENLYRQKEYTKAELLKQYIITDFIRTTHGERARKIIEADWDGKVKFRDVDLTVEFADICFSHSQDARIIRGFDKRLICGPETFACLPIVAIILRLTDLIDFDMKRTPSVLFSHLAVRNAVSLDEWRKHRSVESWDINERSIQFQAKCVHPAIESAIHKFCDIIDYELSVCSNLIGEVNDFNRGIDRGLIIKLPFQVDRKRIETKKNISGKPLYFYRETSFELSKNQVIDLLMGTKLYGETDVALRELIQNSIDACLLRQAMEEKWDNPYTPSIEVKYYKEGDQRILEVNDNGLGMDQYIVDNYYSKVGVSFYKSADFYSLRADTGANFTPTSRFGIGILSCFMVADTIFVDTRKLYEKHKSSDPLSLTIEGHDSIFLIRDGERDSPGTSTKLILRKKNNPWKELSDEQFLKMVETVVPNPPFSLIVKTEAQRQERDQRSFSDIVASSLKDYSWNDNENLRQIEVSLDDSNRGILGSAVIGLLEHHGLPVTFVEMTSKNVNINGETFELTKSIELTSNEIELHSTSITIDDDENIETDTSTRPIARSQSRIALHGIEVPTSLFPRRYEMQRNQVRLNWPFPMLLIVDITGMRDIDLNSPRNRIVMSDNWIKFEEDLSEIICQKLKESLEEDYLLELVKLLETHENEAFLCGLKRVLSLPNQGIE
ncbi:metal-dependent phosphohydrolase [candidate division KSB1 bacterium]|nr:metal-dependent phosphohydrolase [candidate division KSB1 bacterium]